MPIVLMSLVKSMFNSHFAKLNLNPILLVIIICSLALILFILLFIERSEYRLEYNDIMNISSKDTPTYLSWKLNPAGSITIMMSLSIFILENNIVNLIGRLAVDKDFETTIFSFSNPIGITIYLLMQIVLGYVLSRFLINTRRKSKEFLKTEIILRGYIQVSIRHDFYHKKHAVYVGLVQSL